MLTLIEFNDEKMNFAYKFLQQAALFGVFAFAISATTWFLGNEIRNINIYIYWFFCLLSGALFFGTFTTLRTRCDLEINSSKKIVVYSLTTLFENTTWKKSFNEFEAVRLYRPAIGGGQAGRSAIIKVLIRTVMGDEIPLGTRGLGSYSKKDARKLAEKLSQIMSLKVIEESSVERKR